MLYEIKKRKYPAKKAQLPIFRDVAERDEYYFTNEAGTEMRARTLEEAEALVKMCKKYYSMKKEIEMENNEAIVEESLEDIQAADAYFAAHKKAMQVPEIQAYIAFMNNPDNEHNCSECPANQEFSEWPGYRLPCGQFSCWVRRQ